MGIETITSAIVPVILCGGAGSRLWPVSRAQYPKPFIRLDDGESLLQKAFSRGAALPDVTDILTVTNRELFFLIEDEYREIKASLDQAINTSFILEPFGRNTAPAIASACLQVLETHGENAVLLVLAADHLINCQDAFVEAVAKACSLAKGGRLVTFGIQPNAPETGYGYIEASGVDVVRFVEKPSQDKAIEYLNSGNFLWNSGMFCFQAGAMLKEMEMHCPDILRAARHCMDVARKSTGEGFVQVEIGPEDFSSVPEDSIDYAVMEKTRSAAVVACDIGWSDIGCWRSLGDLTPADENNNRVSGDVFIQDSSGCTIKSGDRVVGVVGIDNLLIIDTADALLVAHKSKAQKVKNIYAQLKAQDHDSHKLHRTAHRPWGTYTVLEEGMGFKIKRIVVKPKASLSLQMHQHRSEHWVVVSGTAKVINDSQEIVLGVNESTYIPAGHKHRLENQGTEPLIMIEVQTGGYLGEDDIVRFDDVYGRVKCPA
ncbi:MAG: mannose-1-phosphate guanylyltransferase/mannose-6-phosphate isomerase [Gammaproteobacteria bacterium]|nr:MAG: mannose-1-phosphate guanylyltransferase/mannose-6-phosphate isomerase [Gammaproteobacteria bacterium]